VDDCGSLEERGLRTLAAKNLEMEEVCRTVKEGRAIGYVLCFGL